MNIRRTGILYLALGASGAASAQEVFLPAPDMGLRNDIALLVDRGCISLPVDEWPLARADVARAMAGNRCDEAQDAALQAALSRVAARTAASRDAGQWRIRELSAVAGQPALLRQFDTVGRENGELHVAAGAATDRYGATLSLTGVVDPADGQHLRLDGSDASLRWGNWLLSLNQIDRWWGPGVVGSLILSNNARPMPAVSLDRLQSLPPDLPLLHWVGPWRFSWFFGLGEQHRPDVDQPLFMGMRLSFKPARVLEVGLSRSAQFCGAGRQCNAETFGRMLIGQDNLYYRGLHHPADEPGNQMSGFDVRLVSPWEAVPVALYAQAIGEDNSQYSIPLRYLFQDGVQTWWTVGGASVLRAYVEHADTSTDVYQLWQPQDPRPGFRTDYAYRNHVFFAGYRYRGRTIGYPTDSDSDTTAVGLSLTSRDDTRWTAQWLGGHLDRRGTPDIYDPVTFSASRYRSLQLGWDGKVIGQHLSMQLGHEHQSPASAGNATGLFGFLRWSRTLQ